MLHSLKAPAKIFRVKKGRTGPFFRADESSDFTADVTPEERPCQNILLSPGPGVLTEFVKGRKCP
jgi:hypothetical protein